jgi:hypothetical protein
MAFCENLQFWRHKMILDTEDQRKFLLAVIQNSQIPGAALGIGYATLQAIVTAQVGVPTPDPQPPQEKEAA